MRAGQPGSADRRAAAAAVRGQHPGPGHPAGTGPPGLGIAAAHRGGGGRPRPPPGCLPQWGQAGPLPGRERAVGGPASRDLRREYLATSPPSLARQLPAVTAHPRPWQAFQRTLPVDGDVPEDAWTRVARHWHECYRLHRPAVPGEPRTLTGRPWNELDDFIRQDNILQLRSIMTAVVSRGRRWEPARSVTPGSFIELNETDLGEIAGAEHTRWYRRRLAAGWSTGGAARARRAGRNGEALINRRVVPWTELPAGERAREIGYLRSQLAQLEDVGFVPVVPAGGPPGAAEFQRVGTVQAKRLGARRTWTRRSGDELCGDAGDWRVLDDSGEDRTVRDAEFRYAGSASTWVLPFIRPATTTTRTRSCPAATRPAPPGSPRLRLRPLPRRPHRLAQPAAPDELTGAPTSGILTQRVPRADLQVYALIATIKASDEAVVAAPNWGGFSGHAPLEDPQRYVR